MKIDHKKEYQSGRIGQLVRYMASKYSLDEKMVRADLAINFPELKDKTHCANCGESMAVYIYSVTYLDVRLLCAMADKVTEKIKRGYSFTSANKTHLQTEISDYNLISRQSIASKLGLIAKVMKKNDEKELVHDRKAGWSITTRGYDFLRGEPIPRMIKVFHNRIQERFEDLITMNEILNTPENKHNGSEKLYESAGIFVESYQHPQLLAV